MKRYGTVSVCLSVCPTRRLQQRAAGLLLWARRVGDIDRLLHGLRGSSTGQQHATQQQTRAVPRFQRTCLAKHRTSCVPPICTNPA